MTKDAPEIEVEVVEIDGVTTQRAEEPAHQGNRRDSRQWQGRDFRLDIRWWPLWLILCVIALALTLTVGVVLGVIFLVFRMLSNLLRAILR